MNKATDQTELKDYFLGIGISEYQHFQPLLNAVTDVLAVRHILVDKYNLNIEEENTVVELFDKSATKVDILEKISGYALLPDNARLLIYFSGHGKMLNKKNGYWIPYDGVPDKKFTWISDSNLKEALRDIQCRHILVIADSCFSASFLTQTRDSSFSIREKIRHPSRAGLASGMGLVSDGEPKSKSPFAEALISTLQNNDNSLPLQKMAVEIQDKMDSKGIEQVVASGKIVGLIEQNEGEYCFIPKDYAQRKSSLAFAEAAKKNTLAAWASFFLSYPNVDQADEARIAFESLAQRHLQSAFEQKDKKTLQEFSIQFPWSTWKRNAEAFIDKIDYDYRENEAKSAFISAKELNTETAYKDFLAVYDKSEDAPQARHLLSKRIEQRHVDDILELDTNLAIERQLREIPFKDYSEKNKKKILDHQRKTKVNTALSSNSAREIKIILQEEKELTTDEIATLNQKILEFEEQVLVAEIQKTTSWDSFLNYYQRFDDQGLFFQKVFNIWQLYLKTQLIEHVEGLINGSIPSNKKRNSSSILSAQTLDILALPLCSRHLEHLEKAQIPGLNSSLEEWIDFATTLYPDDSFVKTLSQQAQQKIIIEQYNVAVKKSSLEAHASFWNTSVDDLLNQTTAVTNPKRKRIFLGLTILLLSVCGYFFTVVFQKSNAIYEAWHGDMKKAYTVFEKYKDTNDARMLHYLNFAYLEINDHFLDSGRYLFRAQELGFDRSNYVLARYHLLGKPEINVVKDTLQAVALMKKAMNDGVPDAIDYWGWFYEKGLGHYVQPDKDKARLLYLEAAQKGNEDAQIRVGEGYQYGDRLFNKNLTKAYYFNRLAAQQGSIDALVRLGQLRLQEIENIPADTLVALNWLHRSVANNSAFGARILGYYYSNINLPDSSFYYFKRSAEQGDIHAQESLGYAYLEGHGISSDPKKALELYKTSASSGSANAANMLAYHFYYGVDSMTAVNYDSAHFYALKTLEYGNPEGHWYLGLLNFYDQIKNSSPGKAKEHFEYAYKNGGEESLLYLARIAVQEENMELSADYYNKLAELEYAIDQNDYIGFLDIIQQSPQLISPKAKKKYLGGAVENDFSTADTAFFHILYEDLTEEMLSRNPFENDDETYFSEGPKSSAIAISGKQYLALKKYAESSDDKLLLLLAYFRASPSTYYPEVSFQDHSIKEPSNQLLLQKAANQGNILAAYKLATEKKKEENLEEAKGLFQRVIAEYSKGDFILYNSYVSLGEAIFVTTYDPNDSFAKPIEYLSQALRIYPDGKRPNMILCEIYNRLESLVLAEDYCERARELGEEKAYDISVRRGWHEPGFIERNIRKLRSIN